MLSDAFGPNSIAISTERLSWTEAVSKAVGLLVSDGRATEGYVNEVLAASEKLGPYFVVAPGIAIAHAAPSRSVKATGFALLRLDIPVASGSINDPVRLLFSFCAIDSDSHLELLADFAKTLSEPGKVNLLLNASDSEAIRRHLSDSVG